MRVDQVGGFVPMESSEANGYCRYCGASTCGYGMPDWWHGDEGTYTQLRTLCSEMAKRDATQRRKGRMALLAMFVSIAILHSAEAIGAVSYPVDRQIYWIITLCLALFTIAWVADRRLVQLVRDAGLRARLWLMLQRSIKRGWLDAAALTSDHGGDCGIGRDLRNDARMVIAYLRANGAMEPRIPLLGGRFALGPAPGQHVGATDKVAHHG